MTPELIIFDFDGTLADTKAIILSVYHQTIKELNAEQRSDKACQATIGIPLRDGFKKLYPEYSDTQIDKCVETYRHIYHENNKEPRLFPGVLETLDELRRHGIIMAIASSRSKESLLEYCTGQGIADYFSVILGADDVRHAKPNPEPVLKILEELHIDVGNTIVVGDMPVDIIMGLTAGCATVGVEYGNSDSAELEAAGATFIVDYLPTMLPAIDMAE